MKICDICKKTSVGIEEGSIHSVTIGCDVGVIYVSHPEHVPDTNPIKCELCSECICVVEKLIAETLHDKFDLRIRQ